jgi:hypothetical protein
MRQILLQERPDTEKSAQKEILVENGKRNHRQPYAARQPKN